MSHRMRCLHLTCLSWWVIRQLSMCFTFAQSFKVWGDSTKTTRLQLLFSTLNWNGASHKSSSSPWTIFLVHLGAKTRASTQHYVPSLVFSSPNLNVSWSWWQLHPAQLWFTHSIPSKAHWAQLQVHGIENVLWLCVGRESSASKRSWLAISVNL